MIGRGGHQAEAQGAVDGLRSIHVWWSNTAPPKYATLLTSVQSRRVAAPAVSAAKPVVDPTRIAPPSCPDNSPRDASATAGAEVRARGWIKVCVPRRHPRRRSSSRRARRGLFVQARHARSRKWCRHGERVTRATRNARSKVRAALGRAQRLQSTQVWSVRPSVRPSVRGWAAHIAHSPRSPREGNRSSARCRPSQPQHHPTMPDYASGCTR